MSIGWQSDSTLGKILLLAALITLAPETSTANAGRNQKSDPNGEINSRWFDGEAFEKCNSTEKEFISRVLKKHQVKTENLEWWKNQDFLGGQIGLWSGQSIRHIFSVERTKKTIIETLKRCRAR